MTSHRCIYATTVVGGPVRLFAYRLIDSVEVSLRAHLSREATNEVVVWFSGLGSLGAHGDIS